MIKHTLFALFSVALLSGCMTQSGSHGSMRAQPSIVPNGAIAWTDGPQQEMLISPSGSTLSFSHRGALSSVNGIEIFTRIDSARNGDCEHYYTEAEIRRRLVICANTEVTMMNQGRVERVGRLRVYSSSI